VVFDCSCVAFQRETLIYEVFEPRFHGLYGFLFVGGPFRRFGCPFSPPFVVIPSSASSASQSCQFDSWPPLRAFYSWCPSPYIFPFSSFWSLLVWGGNDFSPSGKQLNFDLFFSTVSFLLNPPNFLFFSLSSGGDFLSYDGRFWFSSFLQAD